MKRSVTLAAVMSCLLWSGLSAPAVACTSFCLMTPEGPVFAENLDLNTGDGHLFVNRRGIAKEGYKLSTTGETARWVSTFGSVTFNLVGRELAWGGMNEAGLVVGTMQLNASRCPIEDERPPLSEGSLVQYVLDTCSNIAEVIQAVSQVRLSQDECTSHYLVADETGNCVVLEFLDGEFVHFTGETLPVKALANAPYAAGIDYMGKGVVPVDNPGASVERVAAAAGKVAQFSPELGISAVDYAFGILTETVVAPKKWWSNLFNEPYTRWNVVYDIAARDIHFRTVESPTVKNLSLSSFDFSCTAPMLMLDVNTEQAGNVGGSFGPYDHDANLKIFREFCDDWGIEVSEEGAIELIELFEGFECSPDAP